MSERGGDTRLTISFSYIVRPCTYKTIGLLLQRCDDSEKVIHSKIGHYLRLDRRAHQCVAAKLPSPHRALRTIRDELYGPHSSGLCANNPQASFGMTSRHLFCNPTSAERGTREIPSNKEIRGSHGFPKHPHPEQEDIVKSKSAQYWRIRERFWMEKLQEERVDRCVFITGAQHVKRFSAGIRDVWYGLTWP